ncbi:MAG: hypothetical protein ABSE59_06870 [Opitutaceae bacterium]|jgi:outer membrane murein-binding lipoprotein Lpp
MRIFHLFVLSLLVVGCTDRSNQAKVAAVQEENKRLEAETITLRQDVAQLKADMKKDEEAVLFLLARMNEADNPKPAHLSGTERGFELARTEYGSFLVSIADVEPYLDGYSVTLSIGNPLDADITAGTISIKYGTSSTATLNTVTQAIDQPLIGGRWTDVVIVVAPAKVEELGYLGVSLDPSGLFLHHAQ